MPLLCTERGDGCGRVVRRSARELLQQSPDYGLRLGGQLHLLGALCNGQENKDSGVRGTDSKGRPARSLVLRDKRSSDAPAEAAAEL